MRQFPLIPLVVLCFFLLTASGCPVGSGPQGGGGAGMGGDPGPSARTTEATPNTVAITPIGVTTLTEVVFEDVTLSAKTRDDGTEVRVKGFYRKVLKSSPYLGGEGEVKVPVEGAEIFILLPTDEKVKTVTGQKGCFFFTLESDKGSKLELSAKKPESEESIKSDLYVPEETPFEVTSCETIEP